MTEFIEKIDRRARAALYLAIAEITFKLVNIVDERYKDGREALDKCWEWVENGNVPADDLYDLIDNAECTGVSEYGITEAEYRKKVMWYTLVDAIAYTSWQAYNAEGCKYLPQSIEGIDEAAIDDFIKNAADTQVFNVGDIDELKEFLLKECPVNNPIKSRIVKEEILKRLNTK